MARVAISELDSPDRPSGGMNLLRPAFDEATSVFADPFDRRRDGIAKPYALSVWFSLWSFSRRLPLRAISVRISMTQDCWRFSSF